MKFRIIGFALCICGITALTVPTRIRGQEQKGGHHHFKLIDLGTFGGPDAQLEGDDPIINGAGIVVGAADTSILDPNPTNCFVQECFVSHAFRWNDGRLTDLGALPGINSSFTNEINAQGVVVGQSQNGLIDPLTGIPEFVAVAWDINGHINNLGAFGGSFSLAAGINNSNLVVGIAENTVADPFSFLGVFFGISPGNEMHAFLSQDGRIRDLGTLGGRDAFAIFVNDRGQIAGASFTNSSPNPTTGIPTVDPFLWENGKMQDLGTLGGAFGVPSALNGQGQVIGTMDVAGDEFFHGFLWDRGVLTDIGSLGGDNTNPTWLNDAGEIAGASDLVSGDQIHHAFRWKRGKMTDLGTVDGDTCSSANAINSQSQIVGLSFACAGGSEPHAFLWEDSGPMIDLNNLITSSSGTHLTEAFFVNDRGEIVSLGVLPNGNRHAFVLIPCDDSHPNIEDCDYSLVDAATAVEVLPTSAVSEGKLPPAELMTRIRSTAVNHYRRFGTTSRP